MPEDKVPSFVIAALDSVRLSNLVNMFNRHAVLQVIDAFGLIGAWNWLNANEERYLEALEAMGAQVADGEESGE